MAVGNGQKVSIETISDSSNWNSWSTNFFLFFLTASQAVLWPWSPVILRTAGLSSIGTAITLSLLSFCSILGVTISLWVVKKTRSGAVRRFFLLGLSVCSVFFCLSAVLILPNSKTEMFCSSEVRVGEIRSVDNILKFTNTTNHPLPSQATTKIHNTSIASNINTNTTSTKHQIMFKNKISGKQVQFNEKQLQNFSDFQPINSSTAPISVIRAKPDLYSGFLASSTHTKPDSTQEKIDFYRPKEAEYTNPWNRLTSKTGFTMERKESANTISYLPIVNIKNEGTPVDRKEFITEEINKAANEDLLMKNNIINKNKLNSPSLRDFLNNQNLMQQDRSPESVRNPTSFPMGNINRIDYDNYLTSNDLNKESKNINQGAFTFGNYVATSNDRLTEKFKPGNIHEGFLYNNKKSGSENFEDVYWAPRILNTGTKRKFVKRHAPINKSSDKRELEYSKSTNESKPDIAYNKNKKFLENDGSSSIGVGVASLLILGLLTGGGIEAAISKFRYCTRHGLQENVKIVDEIDIAISPAFELCVLGQHRHWSLLTCSLWITLPTIFVGLLCQMGANITWPYTIIAVFHGLAGIMVWFILLFIPIPYGCLRYNPKRRPLSLYFDNEVIREGLRRVAFHGWAFVTGVLMALPIFYTFWLLQETSRSKGEVFVAQTISIIALYFGEAVVYPAEKWIGRKLNIQGLMIASEGLLSLYCIMSWSMNNLWFRSGSLLLIGYSKSLLWTVVRNNALLLGTSSDQEEESWASWVCWKIGLSIGAFGWVWASDTIETLLIPGSILGMLSTTVVVLSAIFTRHKNQGRRRIYHSLDLTNVSDDENEELSSLEEDDWLVKRAKKEGMNL